MSLSFKYVLNIFFIIVIIFYSFIPNFAFATVGDGSISSVVEVNSTTANGPTLSNSDRFGSGIANIGDLNDDGVIDLAVAAVLDAGTGATQGAVHILFMNTDGSVDSTVEINGSTTNGPTLSNGDRFGSGIANIGDLNDDGVDDLAIGAHFDDNGGVDRGAVHILFMNTDGSIDSTVEINSSTTNGPVLADSDFLGAPIGLGDLNGDDVEDIAITASGDDEGGVGRGAIHILFMNTDGSVDSTVEINSSTTNGPVLADGDSFGGGNVANIGDLNDDGVIDLAVGALFDDEGGNNFGAVHILFMNTDGSVDSTVEINGSTTNGPTTLTSNDYFGSFVANAGDIDDDGVDDLLVGAQLGDTGGADRGGAYLFFMNTDGSVDSTVEINSNTTNGPTLTNGDYFGAAGDTLGDFDGDGVEDFVIGAWKDDAGGTDRGTIHIFYLAVASGGGGGDVGGSGGRTASSITSTCKPSERIVSAGDEVVFDVNIKSSDEYTFKWVRVLSGDNEEETYEFEEPGKYYPRAEVTNYNGYKSSVNCGSITVLEKDAEEDDEDENENQDTEETTTTTVFTSEPFPTDRTIGDTADEIKEIQKLLNQLNFTLATEGPGSPGNETDFFGTLTKNSLIKFQETFNITPINGNFGPKTREWFNLFSVLKNLGIL